MAPITIEDLHRRLEVFQQAISDKLDQMTDATLVHRGHCDDRFDDIETTLKEHDKRLTAGERWSNRLAGGIAVLIFLFPLTVGVVLAMTRN